RTWIFDNKRAFASTAFIGGPFKDKGKIRINLIILNEVMWLKQPSFEKQNQLRRKEVVQIAAKKMKIEKKKVQFFIIRNLINQITQSSVTAITIDIPYFGLFSACATSMEGLALAAFFINANGANYILSGSSSHNATAERQFRYPTEYGGQKPPTAQ